ncbi:hypothetical protein R5R35_003025 [Gryllus longicercus]|uniref:RRM domain-containing protein n=1 Tax=Gryllus longicercus TaxID=2509291 RepID=A0AAN9W1D4_9ORTH
MDYKVGSLADLISGTRNAASDKQSVVYVPFQNEKTTPTEVTKKSASVGKKRKVNWNEETLQRGKRKKVFSEEVTEEEVEEDDCEDEKLSTRPPKRRKRKIKLDEKQELRTVFVKNIPHFIDKKRLKKKFKRYGTIECIRFRCAPQGDTRIPKKVTVIKKEFHQERTNISAFIRFYEKESVDKALEANGSLIEGHHIFVDRAVKNKNHDQNKAIFLGNVPFAAEENEIWNIFAECGEIEDIRIVRDRETGLGKGFAFVNFKSSDAVELAVHFQGIKLRENELRVMRVTKKLKQTSNQQKNNMIRSNKKTLKGIGHDKNWRNNQKNLEKKALKDKTFSNEYINRKEGKRFTSKNQSFNQEDKSGIFPVESIKKQSISRQSFQGQTLSDTKKKKKINKNEQRKKKIAKMLTN